MILVWDTESRHRKPSGMSHADYRAIAGISIAVTFDLEAEEVESPWKFYSDGDLAPHDIHSLSQALREAEMTVSYNAFMWDHPLVKEHVPEHEPGNELDLANVVRLSCQKAGLEGFPSGTWGLDGVCRRTMHKGKLYDSAKAPMLCEHQRWAQLCQHCMQDVTMTAFLFKYMLEQGHIIGPPPDLQPVEVSEVLENALDRLGAGSITI